MEKLLLLKVQEEKKNDIKNIGVYGEYRKWDSGATIQSYLEAEIIRERMISVLVSSFINCENRRGILILSVFSEVVSDFREKNPKIGIGK